MINTIILGHALNVLPQLPAESVNCCVTSPPYWNLRDYSVEGQLGLEKTFEEYITKLCDIFDQVKRVLRKDGTCWVNMGDSYAGSGKGIGTDRTKCKESYSDNDIKKSNWQDINIPAKSLCDIPYRFSIEMTNRGWIKRNTIIWHKPNCMPSSANDRFTVDFEYLFFFSKSNKTLFWTNEKSLECVSKQPPGIKGIEGKDWEWRRCPVCQGAGGETKINKEDAENMGSPRARYHRITKQEECKRCKGLGKIKVSLWTGHDYWFEQQFEEQSENTNPRYSKEVEAGLAPLPKAKQNSKELNRPGYKNWREGTPKSFLPQGRNKRCVWTIPTQPFPKAHFAVYPEGLIETPIKAGCPEFVCKKCGKARLKLLEPTEEYKEYLGKGNLKEHHAGQETKTKFKVKANAEYKFRGYSDCGCNAGWESGIVLDPFIGSGTTAKEALKQRKRFIGIDIKQEYVDMSYRKIARVQQRIF